MEHGTNLLCCGQSESSVQGAGLNLLTEIPAIAGASKETFALPIKAVYDSYL
jgi:hypothetical protein